MITHLWLLLTNPYYAAAGPTVRRSILRRRNFHRRI